MRELGGSTESKKEASARAYLPKHIYTQASEHAPRWTITQVIASLLSPHTSVVDYALGRPPSSLDLSWRRSHDERRTARPLLCGSSYVFMGMCV